MNVATIVESGMTFGPFPEGQLFRIETCAACESLTARPRIAEFLLLREPAPGKRTMWIVEAKTSAPVDPDACGFTEEITHKMFNSLFMFLGLRLGRFGRHAEELPPPFSEADLSSLGVVFILVVKNHQRDWADQLKSKLNHHFQQVRRAFKLSPDCFLVLNEDMARTHGLVT